MSSRLIAATLRLIAPWNNQSPDNPIQLERLPSDHASRVEFDYPVFQDSPSSATRRVAIALFLAALVAPVLAMWNQFIPIPFVQGGLRVVALLVGTALVTLGVLGPRWPMAAGAAALVITGLLASVVGEIHFGLTALLPTLAAVFLLGDRLGTFYIHLRSAAPVEPSQAKKIRNLWSGRWRELRRPLRGAELYPLAYFVLAGVAVVIGANVARDDGAASFELAAKVFATSIAIAVAWPLLVEPAIAPLFGRRPFRVRAQLRAFKHALAEWYSYNRLNTPGVGIHHSRAGSCFWRRCLLIGAVLCACCLWAGLLPPADRRSNPMAELFAQQIVMEEFYGEYLQHNRKQLNEQPPPPSEFSPPPMSEAEEQLLNRLSPEQAQAFVNERRALSQAEHAQREAQARESEQTRRAGAVVARFLTRLANATLNLLIPAAAALGMGLAFMFTVSARALAGIESLLGDRPRERVLSTANWEMLVSRLQHSKDKTEQESIFLGTLARDDTPVLVPRKVFHEHAHMLGDSGSGKTSIGLVPLVTQLMRYGDTSVIVVDLKADDQSLFRNLQLEAEAVSKKLREADADHPGYRFRWFTSARNRSTYAFNPFTQRALSRLALDQKTDLLTAALGLQYGTDYGRKFFADANYEVLNVAFRQNPNMQSFRELADVMVGAKQFPVDAETKEAASHARTASQRLSRLPALNASPATRADPEVLAESIDCADFFKTPQAAYFALPPASGISTTAEIARLLLYCLLVASQTHEGKRKQVFVVIDEFQRIIAGNLALFLQTARSMQIGVILANQSWSDLETGGASLLSATRTNTRFRQIFGVSEPQDIDDLRMTAGETVQGLRNFSFAPSLFGALSLNSLSVAERPVSRLSPTDVLLATDKLGQSITCVRRGEGYAQFGGMPFIMDSVHHIDPDTYDDRCRYDWPAQVPGTLVSTVSPEEEAPSAGMGGVLEDEPLPAGEETSSTNLLEDLYEDELQATAPQRNRNQKRKRRTPPDLPPMEGSW